MRNIFTRMIAASALAGSAVLAAGLHPGGPPVALAHDTEWRLPALVERLQLDADQASDAADILARAQQGVAADHLALQRLQQELQQQLETFDEATARRLASEIGDINSRMVYRRVAAGAGLYQLLDEAQRLEFQQLRRQRDAHRAQLRERLRGHQTELQFAQ